MRNVDPRPASLATSILPPWFVMIRSQIGRPNPNPLFFLEAKKGWKIFASSLSSIPKPSVFSPRLWFGALCRSGCGKFAVV
jgi:hypothetical protein